MIKIDEKDERVIAFRSAESKLRELVRERSNKGRQLGEARQRLAESRVHSEALDREAEALLAGSTVTEHSTPDTEKIAHELDVINAAIQKQETIVNLARGKFSRAVQEGNRALYLQVEQDIAQAVRKLAAANQAEVDFFEELRSAGCNSIVLRPMGVKSIGLPKDEQGFLAAFEREFREFVHAA
jgi:hypothetical protein